MRIIVNHITPYSKRRILILLIVVGCILIGAPLKQAKPNSRIEIPPFHTYPLLFAHSPPSYHPVDITRAVLHASYHQIVQTQLYYQHLVSERFSLSTFTFGPLQFTIEIPVLNQVPNTDFFNQLYYRLQNPGSSHVTLTVPAFLFDPQFPFPFYQTTLSAGFISSLALVRLGVMEQLYLDIRYPVEDHFGKIYLKAHVTWHIHTYSDWLIGCLVSFQMMGCKLPFTCFGDAVQDYWIYTGMYYSFH
jgi:hypothetical protein